MVLGAIAYLDSQQVDNLLASIEGGLVEQFLSRVRETAGKKAGGGIGIPGTRLGVEGGLEAISEEDTEAIKKTTPVSRLAALRTILIENDFVTRVDAVDEKIRDALADGELLEVQGHVSWSAFEEFVALCGRYLDFGTEFGGLFGIEVDSQIAQMIRYLEGVTSKGTAIRLEPGARVQATRAFDFACILNPQNLMIRKEDLTGTFRVLGRVKRKLERNDVVYPYELVPGISGVSRGNFKALLESLGGAPKVLGRNITEADLRLRGPMVILSPIAMYS